MNDDARRDTRRRLEEARADDPDAFRDLLVRGSDQWWQFLGAGVRQDSSPAKTETEDIDPETVAPRPAAAPQPSSRAFQCRHCDAQNPADTTFCFFCGAQPTERLGYQQLLIVIEEVRDPRLRSRLAQLLSDADEPLGKDEIRELLGDPPCYLFVDGPPGQIEAMLERLGQLGLKARGTTVEATGLGWYRELAESMVRTRSWLAGATGLVALTLLLWSVWSLLAVPVGGAAIGWLLYEHARWYQTHFRLRADSVLERLAGFRPDSANRARQLLAGLRDEDVRKSLTVCLMEYYAVWHQIHASEVLEGPVSRRLRQRLGEFLSHLLDACETFDRIHRFVGNSNSGRRNSAGKKPPKISTKRREELENKLDECRRQLLQLTSSIESLRAKLLSIDLDVTDERADMRLQGLLEDLDTEAEVLEETLDEMAYNLA